MLPVIARTMFRIQERLLGRRTFSIYRDLRESERWPREKLEVLRLDRLRRVVASAYETTPYWRSLMEEQGFMPEDIRTVADLGRFPLLEKSTLRARREEMVWRREGRRIMQARTSGSTNDALEFYTSSNREAHITAARMRGHRWVGVEPGDKELFFWAAPVEVTAQTRVKRFRDLLINNPFTNAVEITPQSVSESFALWTRLQPKCLFSYVSSLSLFVRMSARIGLDLTELGRRGLRAIVTTAEMLSEADRTAIAQSFGVPVHDSYGIREAGLIGHECDRFTMHTNDEQLILETIDPHTLKPTEGEGELVVTSLTNLVMPIIRYRTNDVVTLSKASCPCGCTLHSIRVSGGRLHEFVVTSDGKWVSCVAFLYICKSIRGINELQVRQDRLGEIRILVVPEDNYPEDLVSRVYKAAQQRVGDKDKIVVELVKEIKPVSSNKYRVVISKVAEELLP